MASQRIGFSLIRLDKLILIVLISKIFFQRIEATQRMKLNFNIRWVVSISSINLNKNLTMESQIQKLVNELKATISKKYQLKELRLFGSSARGDRTSESDIDIFVCLAEVNRKIEEDLFDMAYDLELKYGYTIDIFVFDTSIEEGVNSYLPIYRNILQEGITV